MVLRARQWQRAPLFDTVASFCFVILVTLLFAILATLVLNGEMAVPANSDLLNEQRSVLGQSSSRIALGLPARRIPGNHWHSVRGIRGISSYFCRECDSHLSRDHQTASHTHDSHRSGGLLLSGWTDNDLVARTARWDHHQVDDVRVNHQRSGIMWLVVFRNALGRPCRTACAFENEWLYEDTYSHIRGCHDNARYHHCPGVL